MLKLVRKRFEIKEIAWQPVVDLFTGDIAGHEALARFWDDVPPDAAFAQAAQIHAATKLDRDCAAAAFASAPSDGWLFINLCPDTVRTGTWPRIPASLADRVVWELPESSGWEPEHVVCNTPVALDDIGVGHAEALRLREIAWRFLKIDRSVVHNARLDCSAHAKISELVDHAHGTGSIVVAEGIETAEDKALLAELGVRYGQGYLWGKPQARTTGRSRALGHLLPWRYDKGATHGHDDVNCG